MARASADPDSHVFATVAHRRKRPGRRPSMQCLRFTPDFAFPDRFDDTDAHYLRLVDRRTDVPRAGLRVLRTDRPHMLSELYAKLCASDIPRGREVREITHFWCTGIDRMRQVAARNQLICGLLDHARGNGITTFTILCELSSISELLSVGWSMMPLGLPDTVEGAMVCAYRIDLPDHGMDWLDPGWRYRKRRPEP